MDTSSLFSWRLIAGLTLGALAAASVDAQESPFIASTVGTGVVGARQAAMAGRFHQDQPPHLLIVTIDPETGARDGKVYRLGDNGEFRPEPVRQVDPDPNAIVFDTGRIGDHDAVLWMTAGAVIEYDPINDTVRRVVETTSIYNVPMKAQLPRVDFFRDITGDGLGDLVIPDFTGFRVHVQLPGGRFAAPTIVEAPPVMDVSFENHPWYQPRRLFSADMNADGRLDAVVWAEDRFLVYVQGDDGLFAGTPIERPSSVRFEFDSVETASATLRDADQSDLTLLALYQLRDFGGDGFPELVTLTIESSGVFRKETRYDVYGGKRLEDGMAGFTTRPVSSIASSGFQFEIKESDVDANGQIDLAISSVRIGIGKIISALLTGSVDFDLDFFPMRDGAYAESAEVSRQVTASIDLSSGDFFYPFVLITDTNGDGFEELIVQDGLDTLQIYAGTGGRRLFSRDSIDVKLPLPNDPDLVDLVDIDGDGLRDVLLRLEGPGEQARVTVLMTRRQPRLEAGSQ